MSFPRNIFQIWIGSKPMPKRETEWCAQMRKMNPTWKHHILGNELLEKYAKDPYVGALYSQCQTEPHKFAFLCDRLRVLVLRDEGGVYLDADCEPIKPLDTLPFWDWPHADFAYGMRSPHRKDVSLYRGVAFVDNHFLASAKGGRMINRICSLWSPSNIIINGHATGICILDTADFTCIPLGQRYFFSQQVYPETVVMHDAANLSSWLPQRQLAHHG